VEYLAYEYLSILESQIEIGRIFSIEGVLMNLRRTKLGIGNLGGTKVGDDLCKLAQ
jgi:hypothetical protein